MAQRIHEPFNANATASPNSGSSIQGNSMRALMNLAAAFEGAAAPRRASGLAFLRYVGAPQEPLFGRLSGGAAACGHEVPLC